MFPVSLQSVGNIAWDDGKLLATGSDSVKLWNFNTSQFTLLQTVTSRTPLSCLQWTNHGQGLLAGGSHRGSVTFWRKSEIIKDPSRAFIKQDRIFNNTKVVDLQFCPSKPNLLAIGGQGLFIYNLDAGLKSSDLSSYLFKLGHNISMEGTLTTLRWNPGVQHILAGASQNGIATVWDLKNQQTLFNVHDPNYLNRAICSSLIWNPEIPTQFILGYDSESPVLQIWDLRKREYPVKELTGYHMSGITCSEWCPYDQGLFISCDKSGKSVIWSFKTADSVQVIQHQLEGAIQSVHWVPDKKGLICVGDQFGGVQVRSIFEVGVQNQGQVVRGTSQEKEIEEREQKKDYTPKWLKKNGGVAFGFGNKVFSYTQSKNGGLVSLKPSQSSEQGGNLVSMLSSGNFLGIINYFLSSAISQDEKFQWKVMKGLLQKDNFAILSILGVEKSKIIKQTEKYTGKKRDDDKISPKIRTDSFNDTFQFSQLSALDAQDFFNAASSHTQQSLQTNMAHQPQELKFTNIVNQTISRNINWQEGGQKLIKDNLVIKNFECAIDCALMCGRTAEALIIAEHGGPELFARTKNSILHNSHDQFIKHTFLALLNSDIEQLVSNAGLSKWKQTLATIVMHGQNKTQQMASELASKLADLPEQTPAIIALMVAQEYQAVLSFWVQAIRRKIDSKNKNS